MSESISFENYELLRREDGTVFELGRGAMGVTYKAFDRDLHCNVALKVINPGILGSGDARERFLREARAAAQLRHPNIATAFRLGRAADDTHFYAMEFCDGPTLAQAVAERGPLPVYEAVYIAWQVSKALVLAEEHKLLHRDIKPANLIITDRSDEGMVVKVIDFGLAKSFADGQQSLATMSTGGFVGTAQFASPEQLEEKDLDIRSDIYSLGNCLWFMLTARAPFEGSLARVMSQTLTAEPPWEALAKVPEPAVAILRKMLAKNRDDRQPNATALRRELQKCLHTLAQPEAEKKEARPEKSATAALDEATFGARFPVNHRAARDAIGQGYRASDFTGGGESVSVYAFDPSLTRVPALRREIEERVAAAAAHPHPNLLTPVAFSSGAHGVLIATPWTEGFTLLDLLKERGALSPGEVLRVIEPLARAADHAVGRKIMGLDLSKGQIVAHFPGGLSGDARAEILATPVEHWPAFEIKASALSLGDLDSESSGSLSSMATMAPATDCPAALAPVRALAVLACELLGAPATGAYAPIARLSEAANAVLRRAISEIGAFPGATIFAEALRAAIGHGGSSASPLRPKKIGLPPVAEPHVPIARAHAKSRSFVVLILLGVVVLAAAYWFGIHRPRERERDKREADAAPSRKELAPAPAPVATVPPTPATKSDAGNAAAVAPSLNASPPGAERQPMPASPPPSPSIAGQSAPAALRPYQRQANLVSTGNGSGFFITTDGYFVTNHHVVDGADGLEVKTNTRTYEARVVKTDGRNDIAVLKLEGSFPCLPLGDDLVTRPGDDVFTVGFPMADVMGEAPKTTLGTVSALSGVDDDARAFQISVQIQPGNSGGPLVLKSSGNVIGVTSASLNAAKLMQDGRALPQNVNYAMKASYIRPLLATLPGLVEKLPPPRTGQRAWREVQDDVEKCAGLVVILKDSAKLKAGPRLQPSAAPPVPQPRPPVLVGPPPDLRAFVDGVYRHNLSNNAWEWAGDFAKTAWYQYKDGKAGGTASQEFIAKDRQSLIAEYPSRAYSKQPGIEFHQLDNERAQVTMTFVFQYDGPKKSATGSSTVNLSCERFGGSWKVTRFAEKASSRVTRK